MLNNEDLYVETLPRSVPWEQSYGVRMVHLPTGIEVTENECLSSGTNFKVARRRLEELIENKGSVE